MRQDGHNVVVYDQFTSPAAVGSGLIVQASGKRVLEALGLCDRLYAMGAPIKRLYGVSTPSGRRALDVRFTKNIGYGVRRAGLFDLLYECAEKTGVRFEFGQAVNAIIDQRLVFVNGMQSPRFDLVVDATGLNSPLNDSEDAYLEFGAVWMNVRLRRDNALGGDTLEQRYYRSSKTIGLLPTGVDPADPTQNTAALFWSLPQDDYSTWRDRGVAEWKSEVHALWPDISPLLDCVSSPDDLIFARYAHRTISNPVRRSVVHIGDAWHAASPQLGQGANMAMLDAMALSNAMCDHADLDSALNDFYQRRRRHVLFYQMISALFTPLYQSHSQILPVLRDYLLTPLSQLPPAQKILARIVSGTLLDSFD